MFAILPFNKPEESICPKGETIQKCDNYEDSQYIKPKTIMAESYEEYRKKKKALKKKRVKESVNEYEIYMMAKLIYCEVGTVKDDRCLYLCGSVVLNRMQDKRYPDTMEGVIFQRGQYEVTWNGAWERKTPDKRCLRIAHDLLKKGTVDKRVMGMSERVWGKFHSRYGNVIFSIL